eukprot:g13198.t1 g13198   contig8:140454-141582(+)
MNRRTTSFNTASIMMYLLLFITLQLSLILTPTSIFHSAFPMGAVTAAELAGVSNQQQQKQCSDGDETCKANYDDNTNQSGSFCQVGSIAHMSKPTSNCSPKEIDYVTKMKDKSSKERQEQVTRLEELLTRGESEMNQDLIPWIEQRIHILRSLEAGIGDDTQHTTADATSSTDGETTTQNEASAPTTDRLITIDELSQYTGKGGASPDNPIWLSILGKVYDVTTGEDFYGEKSGSYKFYSGRDASPCFSSGKNNPEGAEEDLSEWEAKKLISIYEWSEFYEKHETYKYLGVLVGSKYYDEEGRELPLRKTVVEKASEAKAVAEKEKEEKRRARKEKRLKEKQKK